MNVPLFIEDIKGYTPFDSDNMKGFSLAIKERRNFNASCTDAE